jgi:hypothetical protein
MDAPTYVILLVGAMLFVLLYNKKKASKQVGSTSSEHGWVIGPVVHGKNFSVGMPEHPTPQGAGWSFVFPGPGGKVGSVAWFDPPSLVGAKALVLRFSVTGGGFAPSEFPDKLAVVSLMLQRKGDDWSGTGGKADYRLYSHQLQALQAGDWSITVPLDPAALGNVLGKPASTTSLDAMIAALSNIAVAFGHDSGVSHGVYATQPSTFTLLGLEIQR